MKTLRDPHNPPFWRLKPSSRKDHWEFPFASTNFHPPQPIYLAKGMPAIISVRLFHAGIFSFHSLTQTQVWRLKSGVMNTDLTKWTFITLKANRGEWLIFPGEGRKASIWQAKALISSKVNILAAESWCTISDVKWQKEEGIKSHVIPVLYQNKSENRNRGKREEKKLKKE